MAQPQVHFALCGRAAPLSAVEAETLPLLVTEIAKIDHKRLENALKWIARLLEFILSEAQKLNMVRGDRITADHRPSKIENTFIIYSVLCHLKVIC